MPEDKEEIDLVEMVLHCVEVGSAGHWKTVAGILAEEVKELRAALNSERKIKWTK